MSSSFQMWSATPAAIAARGDLGCQDVDSVKPTHYPRFGAASTTLVSAAHGRSRLRGLGQIGR